MHVGIIFFLVILGSVLFHIFTPWYWTDVASNLGGMDDTITLTFWVGGGVFVAVCLFMIYCVFKFSYKKDRKAEYKPEDKKLERILTWATTLGVAALLAPGLIIWNQFITVPKNEIVSIIGKSGVGKSILLKSETLKASLKFAKIILQSRHV